MKRQGVEGFTWDSEAEEWADWCWSVLVNDPPRTVAGQNRIWRMIGEYQLEYGQTNALEARHSPAQPQNTAETGQPTGRGTIALLCLQVGVIAGAITFIALFIF